MLILAATVAFVAVGCGWALLGSDVLSRLAGLVGAAVLSMLGLLPQLEFVTGRGGALTVDADGIRLARWLPLQIPWSDVVGVEFERRWVVVVYTTDSFATTYRRARPYLLRATATGPARLSGSGFVISNLIAAHPDALAIWLAYEARRRAP